MKKFADVRFAGICQAGVGTRTRRVLGRGRGKGGTAHEDGAGGHGQRVLIIHFVISANSTTKISLRRWAFRNGIFVGLWELEMSQRKSFVCSAICANQ